MANSQSGRDGDSRGGLDGVDRAAILLMALGEQAAAQVLKHMEPKEVQQVSTRMAGLKKVSREQVGSVLLEFFNSVSVQTSLGVNSESYIRNVLVRALGEEKAAGIIDQIQMGTENVGLDKLKWMDPRRIAETLGREHPQIISVVLSHLDPDVAANVLERLDEKLCTDVLLRIATLDVLQPNALDEINVIVDKQLSSAPKVSAASVGGVKKAATILNAVDTAVELKLLEKIREFDAELGDRLEELMFVFDDLVSIDNRGVQALLREISTDTLVVALKGADEAVKEKIFQNMSKRASEMLRDDLEAKGPVKLSEVEGAQKEILAVARRMAEAGELMLGGKGGGGYV